MKKSPIFHLPLGLFILPLLVAWFVLTPPQAQAQENVYPEPSERFTREELAQMLAPIALYPDALLSQILMASTYPIEVVEADRWVGRNPGLKGEALDAALLDKNWDPSVKAICHFPSILALMSERISETTDLGNAFLAQEAEVMEMIQELRARAHAQGNLTTNSQQTVVVERETIIIEPAYPTVIYVPYYDPFYVYGPWWYPDYPPYYWGPPRVSLGYGISYWPAFYFSFTFGNWCYFDWHRHYIFIDVHHRPRFVRHDRWLSKPGPWQHAPSHRRGVAYRDKHTARKYGQSPRRPDDFRSDTRGYPERRDPDRDRVRRGDGRTRTDQDRRVDDNSRLDRNRQEQQRVERDRQERTRLERERQGRERVEREQADRERQQRQTTGRDRQERQERPRADQERRTRERAEREQQQRSRDNVFNPVEDGSRERLSGERGRYSRQGRSGESRDSGRSGGDSRDGRDDRGRNRR